MHHTVGLWLGAGGKRCFFDPAFGPSDVHHKENQKKARQPHNCNGCKPQRNHQGSNLSNQEHQSSNQDHQTSNCEHQTSNQVHQTSNQKHQTSNQEHQNSTQEHQTLDDALAEPGRTYTPAASRSADMGIWESDSIRQSPWRVRGAWP